MCGGLKFMYEVLNQTVPNQVNKSKWENTAWLKLTDMVFLGLHLSSNFLKKHNVLEAGSLSVLKQRSP